MSAQTVPAQVVDEVEENVRSLGMCVRQEVGQEEEPRQQQRRGQGRHGQMRARSSTIRAYGLLSPQCASPADGCARYVPDAREKREVGYGCAHIGRHCVILMACTSAHRVM